MTKIKIFVSYKERHKIIESDIITPIQTGRAIASEIFKEMIGDDTGENISKENPKYNELSAQYWVWKNYDKIGNPDYVGFMHYRRHFLFNEKKKLPKNLWLPKSNWYKFNKITKDYLKFLTDKSIKNCISGYDCIVPKKYDYTNYMHKNIIDDFTHLREQKIENLLKMIAIVKKLFPEYADTADEVKNGHYKHIANMFIMTKEMFFEYSEFLFSIEKELDKQINYTNYSPAAKRVLGFCGEIILTIFIFQKAKENKYRLKEINTSFIDNKDSLIKKLRKISIALNNL